ncbi:uncharacterized protein DNG_06771 [Cephalotrichum gorgonifer]|uniref:Uncharacterized protein n=1 Tax=Cephalotrichum gorgonifer TaxID=2041049 RepID=A0AAE8N334_9PEZI|nr:uncharacterized protein DNG_06771 [Cephalotrichum gorgonifer]
MPLEVYTYTKSRLHLALRALYLCVASPIDGPAKSDFGDIDIIVTWSRRQMLGIPPSSPADANANDSSKTPDELTGIYHALGAERMTRDKGSLSAHYAIPWPPHLSHLGSPGEDARERYIQVDVTIKPSLPSLQWALFKHAHGDLWNILGTMIRPLGLTVDETALWIRVPEIEAINRARAKVKVTDDPLRVLSILGLEVGSFWEEPFASLDDLFEYAATSSMFWVHPAREELAESTTSTDSVEPSISTAEATAEAQVVRDKKALKSNDRRRMNTRPCFRAWHDEFLPRCRAENRFSEARHTRSSVAALIFSLFPIEEEFEARRLDFEIEQQRNDIWKNKIKGFVSGLDRPGGLERESPRGLIYRGCLSKALKRIILEGDERYGVLPRSRMTGDDGRYITQNVEEFIREEYVAVGDVAMRMNDEQYVEKLKRELEKKGEGPNGESIRLESETIG